MSAAIVPPWSPTTVIINDVVTDDRQVIFFVAEDFSRLKERWNEPDALLIGLQGSSLFKDRTRWRDLNPVHFRFLLTSLMEKITPLSDEDRYNPEHPTTGDLTWLLMGLIRCTEFASQSAVETLYLTRLKPYELLLNVHTMSHLNIEKAGSTPSSPKKNSFLKVVVDNE